MTVAPIALAVFLFLNNGDIRYTVETADNMVDCHARAQTIINDVRPSFVSLGVEYAEYVCLPAGFHV